MAKYELGRGVNGTIATRGGKNSNTVRFAKKIKKAHTHNIKVKINQSLETTKSYQKKKKT